MIYLLATRDGRRLLADLFPVKKDLADVWQAVRYLAGLTREKPKIGRFGYAEKMEYWAVVWGTIIMGATGLTIWLKIAVTRFSAALGGDGGDDDPLLRSGAGVPGHCGLAFLFTSSSTRMFIR